jgi:hypothetical protein
MDGPTYIYAAIACLFAFAMDRIHQRRIPSRVHAGSGWESKHRNAGIAQANASQRLMTSRVFHVARLVGT